MITPTQDGILIDCGGERKTWGCGCGDCLPRNHPLDIGVRLPAKVKAEWGRRSASINREVPRETCHCGKAGRLYAGGWRCADHVFQAARMISEEIRDAIGSYAREHGTSPWPRKGDS